VKCLGCGERVSSLYRDDAAISEHLRQSPGCAVAEATRSTPPLLSEAAKAKIEKYGLRLDIGPGCSPRDPEKFVMVDKYEAGTKELAGFEPDVHADMGDLPFETDSVQEIWCAHTLEHAAMTEVPGVLKEWLRVLKPGARLVLQVPNLDYVAKYWLTGPDRKWAEMMVFGEQRWGEGDFHRCAFTSLTLRGDLEGAGFTVDRIEMRWSHNQETIQAVARKPVA
jgi:SAM-dependent methyltransferase